MAVAALLVLPLQAQAQTTFVSNLGQSNSSSDAIAESTAPHAQQFETGSNAGGYTLTEIVVNIRAASTGTPAFALYTSKTTPGGDEPDVKVVELSGISSTAGEQSFTPASATTLSASTKYFVVFTMTTGSASLQRTSSNDIDSGASTGWDIAETSVFSANSGTSWSTSSRSLEIAVKGTLVSTTPTPPPMISSIAFTSAPGTDATYATYAISDPVTATVTFSSEVDITVAPQLELDFDGTSKTAACTPETDTATTTCTYIVVEDDVDADGIAIQADALTLPTGATIRATGTTVDADLTHAALAAQAGHKVDGVRPTLVSAATSADGTRIFVTFSEPLQSAVREDFTVTINGSTATLDAHGFFGGATGLELALNGADTVAAGDRVTVTLAAFTVIDLANNWNAPLAATAVTNTVPPPMGTPMVDALISNVGQVTGPTARFSSFDVAQPFTTGANVAGYTLTEISLKFVTVPAGTDTVTMLVTDGLASTDTIVATMTNPGTWAATSAFTAPSGTTLDPGTTYYVIVESSGGLGAATFSGADPGAAEGWSFAHAQVRSAGTTGLGGTWEPSTAQLQIAVGGTVIPAPAITAVALSDPGSDDTYAIDDIVTATVTFSAAVDVAGAPQLELDFNGTMKTAPCEPETNTTTLSCAYDVVEGDADADGIAIHANRLTLPTDSDTIRATGSITVNAVLAHAGLAADAGHKVDGVRPTLVRAETSTDGTRIILTFSEDIDSIRRGNITVTVGGTAIGMSSASVESSGAVVTIPVPTADTVEAGETVMVALAADAVEDAAGNGNAAVTATIVTNTVAAPAPTVTNVAFTSAPGTTYGINGAVEATVTFSSNVDITGAPQLALDFDGTSKPAGCLAATDTATATCTYIVVEGDVDADGIAIEADALTLPTGATIRATGTTVDADLTHAALAAQAGHTVDGVRPTLSSAETSAAGTEVLLTFSEPLFTGSFPASLFTVTVDATAVPVTAAVSGSTVTLTLATALTAATQGVTVSYTNLGSVVLDDVAGNRVATFTDQPVTNTVPAPSTAPIWSTTMTVEEDLISGVRGYSDPFGALGTASFEYAGVTYTVNVLTFSSARGIFMHFTLDVASDKRAGFAGLVLEVGGHAAPVTGVDSANVSSLLFGTLPAALDADRATTLPAEATATVCLRTTSQTCPTGSITPPPASPDATLSALTLSDGTLTPAFAAGMTDYTATVGPRVAQITVTATPAAGATIAYTDADDVALPDADATTAGLQVALDEGANTITVTVTAEDGTTTQTYTVIVTREAAPAPTISSVEFTSTPGSDNTYAIGDTVTATVTFTDPVDVTVAPQLELDFDATPKTAACTAETNTATTTCTYIVVEDDVDTDGIAIQADKLTLPNGTITATGSTTINAVLTHAALAAQSGHKVDGIRPTLVSAATSAGGTRIFVTFSEPLQAAQRGNFTVTINGSTATLDSHGFFGGSTGIALTLNAADTVAAGDRVTVTLAAGTVTDLANNASVARAATAVTNTVPPPMGTPTVDALLSNVGQLAQQDLTFSDFDVAQPFTTGANVAGYTLTEISLKFNSVPAGTATVTMLATDGLASTDTIVATMTNPGTWALTSAFTAPSGTTLDPGTTYYVIVESSGGLGAATFSGADPGAAEGWSFANVQFRNAGTTGLGGTWSRTSSRLQIAVGGTVIPAPAITAVALTSDPGSDDTYAIDDIVTATVTFSAAVDVAGAPQLELDFNGTMKTAPCEPETNTTTLSCAYDVVEGDADADGIAIHANRLTLPTDSDTIRAAGSIPVNAVLAHAGLAADADHKVDGIRPTLVSAETSTDGTKVIFTFSEEIGNVRQLANRVLIERDGFLVEVQGTTRISGAAVEVPILRRDTIQYGQSLTGLVLQNLVADSVGNRNSAAGRQVVTNTVPRPPGLITGVAITSDPGMDGIYLTDDVIEVTVTYDVAVAVTGTPRIRFFLARFTGHLWAEYARGSGSTELVFDYTVKPTDETAASGVAVGRSTGTALDLNNGTITVDEPGGADVSLSYTPLAADADHLVNWALPTLVSAETSIDGTQIILTFSETLLDNPQLIPGILNTALTVTVDGTPVTLTGSVSGISGDTVTLTLSTPLTSAGQSITVGYVPPLQQGLQIQDLARGSAAAFSNQAVTNTVVPSPAITSVAFNNQQADNTYAIGNNVLATVTFSEAVDVTGTPELEFDVGGTPKAAACFPHTGDTAMLCHYLVEPGLADADGIAIQANKLTLPGGATITATGTTRNADLTHDAVAADARATVDAIRPTRITTGAAAPHTSTDGTKVLLTFSEPLDPAGTGGTWAVTVGGMAVPATPAVAGSRVTLTLATALTAASQVVTVSYADPDPAPTTNDATVLQDVPGNDAASFAGQTVTNRFGGNPRILGVALTSAPGADETYAIGESVEATVTFSDPVDVTGTPLLVLHLVRINDRKIASVANCAAATNTVTMVCAYEVAMGDIAASIAIPSNQLTRNGATLRAAGSTTTNAVITYDAVAADAGHRVDGIRPTLLPSLSPLFAHRPQTSLDGTRIILTFSEELDSVLRGNVTVTVGGTAIGMSSASVEFSGAVVTIPVPTADTVEAGETVLVALAADAVKDTVGNGNLAQAATTVINTVPAAPGAVTVLTADIVATTTPGSIGLTFNDAVGADRHEFRARPVGESWGEWTDVTQETTPGSVTFDFAAGLTPGTTYTLEVRGVNSVGPGPSSNQATGTAAAAVTITGVALTSDPDTDQTYAIGDFVYATLTFSRPVTIPTDVTARPQLELDFNGTGKAATCAAVTQETEVRCDYRVVSGDTAPNGIGIRQNTLTPNGGRFQLGSGLTANTTYAVPLAHPGVGAQAGHMVDGVRPTPVRAETSTDGTQVLLTFSEEIRLIDVDEITVTVDGTATGSFVQGHQRAAELTLTLPTADVVATGEMVTVALGANAVEDLAGNGNLAQAATPVTNRVGAVEWAFTLTDADGNAVTELTEGGDAATATVTITNDVRFDTAQTVTIQWWGADLGTSFIEGAGGATTLTIPAQQASGTLSIHVPRADHYHPPRTRALTAVYDGSQVGESIDVTFVDEGPAPVASITEAPSEVNEGESIEIQFVLDRPSLSTSEILIAITDVDGALSGTLQTKWGLFPFETEETLTYTADDNSVQHDGARAVTFALALNDDAPFYTLGDPSSVTVTVLDNDTPPSAPRTLTAEPGATEARLAWQPPETDHGQPFTYEYRSAASGASLPATWTAVPSSDATTTGYTVTGLTHGTAYTVEVRATNVAGPGDAASVTTTTLAPEWAFTLTDADGHAVTELTEGGASATATVSITNGVTFSTDQTVRLKHGSRFLAGGLVQGAGDTDTITIPMGQSSGSLEISAPEFDEVPHYTSPFTLALTATHGGNQIGESIDLTFVDNEPVPVATITEAPSSVNEGEDIELELTLTPRSIIRANVKFTVTDTDTALSGTLPTVTRFGAGQATETISLTAAENTTQNDGAREVTFTLELNPDALYTLGTPSTATITVRDDDTPPSAPRTLTAEPGATEARLAWQPPETDHGQPFTYEYRSAASGASLPATWTAVPSSDATTTGYTVTGLTHGTAYTVEVRATNVAGPGDAASVTTTTRVPPTVTNVAFTSLFRLSTYLIGWAVEATVTFSSHVDITGAPQLVLDFDGVAKTAGCLTDRMNTATATCTYIVVAGDVDVDGIAIQADALTLPPGATIRATGTTVDADLTHAALAAQAGHTVDGIRPTLVTTGTDAPHTSADGTQVLLTFSEPLDETNTPPDSRWTVNVDGSAVTATVSLLLNQSVTLTLATALTASTQAVTVSYVDRTTGNDVTVVQDLAGNDAASFTDVAVTNTVPAAPTISSIAFTSVPGSDATYGIGGSVEVTVDFSSHVDITGAPELALDFDGVAKPAGCLTDRMNTATATCTYIVVENDEAPDGIAIKANKLTGGTITATGGTTVDADLTHAALAAQAGHTVDGVRPTLVTTGTDAPHTSTDGTQVILTLSEAYSAFSTSHLSVTINDTALTNIRLHPVPGMPNSTAIMLASADTIYTGDTVTVALGADTLNDLAGNGNVAQAATPVSNDVLTPGAPSDLTASSTATTTPGSIRVDFTKAPGADRHEFRASTDSGVNWGGWTAIVQEGNRDFAAGLTPGTTYTLEVQGVNSVGPGPPSNQATGTAAGAVSITGVALTSNPGPDNTYSIGDPVEATLTYSRPVTIKAHGSNLPQLTLDVGGTSKPAPCAAASQQTAVVCTYTVEETDAAPRGVAIAADVLTRNTATVQLGDVDPNTHYTVPLAHARRAADTNHKVDGIRPTLVTMGADAPLTSTDGLQVILTFSEPLDPAGTGGTWAVTVDGMAVTATPAVAGSRVTLTLATALTAASQLVTVSYADPAPTTNDATVLQDVPGNDAASFANQVVTNRFGGNPRILGVALTSAPGADETYAIGDFVTATVTFTDPVDVTVAPQLELDFDGTSKTAACTAETNTATTTCTYIVVADDMDVDGIAIQANKLTLPSGMITATGSTTVNAVLTHAALAAQAGHKVDGIRPTLVTAETSTDGTQVILTFSEDIDFIRRENITVTVGGTAIGVSSVSIEISGAVVTIPVPTADTVEAGETVMVALAADAVEDTAGNGNAEINDQAVTNTVPAAPAPTVTNVAFTSASGTTYGIGGAVDATVTFSSNVDITGAPQLALDFDGTSKPAGCLAATNTATATCTYIVVEGDVDADGIAIEADALTLPTGATIRATGTTADADLTHAALAAQAGHTVDGVRPTLVTTGTDAPHTSTDGTQVILTLSEAYSAFSTSHLSVTINDTALTNIRLHPVPGMPNSTAIMLASADTIYTGDTVTVALGADTLDDLAGNGNVAQAATPVSNDVLTPGAPSDLTASSTATTTPGSIRVDFTKAPGADRHEFRASTDSGVNWGGWTAIVQEGNNDFAAGLTPGTTYTLEVQGVNSVGPGPPSNQATGTAAGAVSITGVALTSNPGPDNTYSIGDPVEATLTYSRPVTIKAHGSNLPQLTLDVGGTSKPAPCAAASQQTAVVCTYTVEETDAAPRGVAIAADVLTRNTATVQLGDVDPNTHYTVPLAHARRAADTNHKVDGIRPTLVTMGADAPLTSTDGMQVILTFSEPLDPAGTGGTWAVTVDGMAVTATPAVAGSRVTLTLATALTAASQVVTVSYADPAPTTNDATVLQDVPGNDAASFANQVVTNRFGGNPRILGVALTSAPGADETYAIGDFVTATVTFTDPVDVTVAPQLELDFDGTSKTAACTAETNTATTTCTYIVVADDMDVDGIAIQANKLTLPSGMITATGSTTVNAVLTHAALAAQAGHKVDGIRPTLVTAETSTDGTQVILTFSEDIDNFNDSLLGIQIGQAPSGGSASISGNVVTVTTLHIIRFGQTVTVSLVADTAEDAVGNGNAEIDDQAVTNTVPAVTAPTISSIALTSLPGSDATYAIGDTVTATVTFTDPVDVTVAPQLELDFDGTSKTAACTAETNTATTTCTYIVVADDVDVDGIAIQANKLTLPTGATITATGSTTVNAVLAHAALAAQSGHKVDGVRPTLVRAETSAALELKLFYDENLDGGSEPAPSAFTVTVDAAPRGVTGVALDETKVLLTLASAVRPGETVTVSYTVPAMNPIRDEASNPAAAFSDHPVKNIVPATVPDAPTGLEATPGDGSVTLRWTASAYDGGSEVTSHQYRHKTTGGFGSWQDIELSAPGEANVASFLVTSLMNGTAYTFEVRARNEEGESGPSNQAGTTPDAAEIASPEVVRALSAGFGRMVGSQALRMVSAHLEGGGGTQVTVGGERLGGSAEAALARLEAASRDGDEGRTRTGTGREALLGSSFRLQSGGKEAGAPGAAAWGAMAAGRFETRSDGVATEGEVTTGMVGADLSSGRWLVGGALSHARGKGSFASSAERAEGEAETRLTAVHPYARVRLGERLSAWGLAGYGKGELTVTAAGGERVETGLRMRMGAVGARGTVVAAPAGGGFELALKTDALWMRVISEAAEGLPGVRADARRLRLVLDASRVVETAGGATLTPRVEAGVRRDGGDTQRGTGLEVGAGLRYARSAVTVEGRVRALVLHEASGYEEWGASGSVRVEPSGSGRGLSLTLAPTWGDASSAVERLWSLRDPGGLAANADIEPRARLDAELGYGLTGPRGVGVATPYAGLGLAREGERAWRAGARWDLAPRFTLGFEATRREPSTDAPPEHRLMLRGALRW